MTPREAREKIHDPAYLAEIRARMADPAALSGASRPDVPAQVVTALIEELENARASNAHNFAVARAALAERKS